MTRPLGYGHVDGIRGCECQRCKNRRAYAKKRYAEKKQGINLPPVSDSPSITTRNREVGGREPRLMESKGEEGVISHWLPDAEKSGLRSWDCPECGMWFHWNSETERWVQAS